VGEGGRRLSTGQRQCIALARALVDEPVVLLLDEPTAHLDEATAARLRQTLAELARDRLVVAATHSRELLSACLDAAVLVEGKLAGFGPPPVLMPQLFPAAARGAAKEATS
jgi:ATP-binding cassette subfamily C protein LapB